MPENVASRGRPAFDSLPPRAGGAASRPDAGKLRTWGRFVRFEHTLFSLPMLYAGLLLGAGLEVSAELLLLVFVAGAGARTAALGLNRIIDRRIDRANPRTATRELPSGAMSLVEAWGLVLVGVVVYGLAAWGIAPICLALAPIPLVVFVAYPYMKRFTAWCHLGVGVGLAMAPLGGWFAGRLAFEGIGPPILLGGFTLFWVAGFDVIYSTLDEAFDRRAGIHSLPARHGKGTALKIARGMHALAWLCLAAVVAWRLALLPAAPFLFGVGALLAWEHVKADDIDLAFFRINVAVGFLALAAVLAGIAPWALG